MQSLKTRGTEINFYIGHKVTKRKGKKPGHRSVKLDPAMEQIEYINNENDFVYTSEVVIFDPELLESNKNSSKVTIDPIDAEDMQNNQNGNEIVPSDWEDVETEQNNDRHEQDEQKLICLLKDIDLEVVGQYLKAAQITYKSLRYLRADDLKEAIPSIGLRAEFREKLFMWRKNKFGIDDETVSFITQQSERVALVHYATAIRKCGPSKYIWCMRFEAKHKGAKMYLSNIH